MPTTVQNPQLMSPPLSAARPSGLARVVYDDRPCNLVVPALLAPVEGDPQESETRRNARDEVREEAPNEPARGWLRQAVGGDDFRLHQHLPRRGPAEAPE